MEEFLLAHVGVPLMAGLVLLFMVAASDSQPLTLHSCNEIALDLVILSTGATGAIFLDSRLGAHWKNFTPVIGIFVVLVDLLLASFLVYRRRWRPTDTPVSRGQAYLDLLLGALGLTVTVMVFYLGYQATATGGQGHG